MFKQNLYFRDGTLFADDYVRVVQGKRGNYVELTKEQIKVPLESYFNQKVPDQLSNENFYYYRLKPKGREEKVYWQCNLVKYADYKRNFYYIDPKLLT